MYVYNTLMNTTPPPSAQILPANVPIGTIIPYAGKDIPDGWIACDNASYPTTTYPLLFSKIGYTYGTDDTKYRVPDTRGVFMRGMDATATRDANRPAGSIQLSGTIPDVSSIFTGASASATGGVGYVPAPLAGQQNMFLCGKGSWQNANVANYYHAALTSNPAANTNMVFNTNVVSAGTLISTTNGSSFVLAAGHTYKIFVNVTYNNFSQTNAVTTLIIYNNASVIATGRCFIFTGGCCTPFVASAFITPVVTANVVVLADYAMVATPGFITIEVVRNSTLT